MISRGAATHQYLLAFRQARAPLFAVVPRREMHTHQLTATQDNANMSSSDMHVRHTCMSDMHVYVFSAFFAILGHFAVGVFTVQ